MTDRAALVDQLSSLGIERGDVLLVHTSYRAVRPVDGGPAGLIEALLECIGPGGTLVMPSWSGEDDVPFDPRKSPVAADLGIVARVFARWPGVARSVHPFAFAAVGPHAGRVLQDPLPLPPHAAESPVGRVHELDGRVLLLGVDHTADTTIHLAEILAGVPYGVLKYCTVLRDSGPVRVDYRENDHCCQRFARVGDWLAAAGLQHEGPVANGSARLCRSRDIVREVTRRLAADPLLFLHAPDVGCADCDEARASI